MVIACVALGISDRLPKPEYLYFWPLLAAAQGWSMTAVLAHNTCQVYTTVTVLLVELVLALGNASALVCPSKPVTLPLVAAMESFINLKQASGKNFSAFG